MKAPGPAGEPHASPPGDGGGAKRRRVLLVAALLALVLVGGYGCLRTRPDSQPVAPADAAAAQASAGNDDGSAGSTASETQMPHDFGDTSPDLKDVIPAGTNPDVAEVIARLRAAGVTSGIAAFNPPGTSPPLIGIAVPDDFDLPEGFVRHSQATDDGQPLEPILMFSPDYDFFDGQGRPIQVPENRVVPPQHAPPGLQIRMIRIPPAS